MLKFKFLYQIYIMFFPKIIKIYFFFLRRIGKINLVKLVYIIFSFVYWEIVHY